MAKLRVLVCGGRKFNNWHIFFQAIKDVVGWHGEYFPPKDLVIISGGAPGADELARILVKTFTIEYEEYAADWKKHGRAAGPIRNQKMLDEGKPDCVLAMPGGRGTADMVRRAKEAGIITIEYNDEERVISSNGSPRGG